MHNEDNKHLLHFALKWIGKGKTAKILTKQEQTLQEVLQQEYPISQNLIDKLNHHARMQGDKR